MVPSELTGLDHYLAPEENPILIPDNLSMMQNTIPGFDFNRFLNSHELFSQSLSASTSDEAEEHQASMIVDERKQRRMISNRESARRSRMRKQKHLDELWLQVTRLQNENHSLIDKLNHVSENHDQVVQENKRLKEETSDLRRIVTDLRIGSSFLEEIPCNSAYLRAEPTNQSIANSVDLLY